MIESKASAEGNGAIGEEAGLVLLPEIFSAGTHC